MSYTRTIVCLANSRKPPSGRCIAGREKTSTGFGSWVRPVSARPTQEISEEERRYENGTSPKLLDVIAVELNAPQPQNHQQENHLIDDGYYWVKQGVVSWQDLQKASVKRMIDVRLNNVSQLAGFAKKNDLRYFLGSICGIEYVHRPDLAPTQEMLDSYKKHNGLWSEYEKNFLRLMVSRRIEDTVPRKLLDDACLLCSEDKPDHCHRRLVAEYLKSKWGDLDIVHL